MTATNGGSDGRLLIWGIVAVVVAMVGYGLLGESNRRPQSAPVKAADVKSEVVKPELKVGAEIKQAPLIQVPQPVESPSTPPVQIFATELSIAYEANELSADAQYKGKELEVVGTVVSIGSDLFSTPYIVVDGRKNGAGGSVQCMFSGTSSTLRSLKKGDNVNIIGRCDGLSIGSVLLRKCRLK